MHRVVTVLLFFCCVITALEDQAEPDTENLVTVNWIETADNSRMIAPSKIGARNEVRVGRKTTSTHATAIFGEVAEWSTDLSGTN
jgi:hypothetical protein